LGPRFSTPSLQSDTRSASSPNQKPVILSEAKDLRSQPHCDASAYVPLKHKSDLNVSIDSIRTQTLQPQFPTIHCLNSTTRRIFISSNDKTHYTPLVENHVNFLRITGETITKINRPQLSVSKQLAHSRFSDFRNS
jgi:hypothetical protein